MKHFSSEFTSKPTIFWRFLANIVTNNPTTFHGMAGFFAQFNSYGNGVLGMKALSF
jgi:hypothetical protein